MRKLRRCIIAIAGLTGVLTVQTFGSSEQILDFSGYYSNVIQTETDLTNNEINNKIREQQELLRKLDELMIQPETEVARQIEQGREEILKYVDELVEEVKVVDDKYSLDLFRSYAQQLVAEIKEEINILILQYKIGNLAGNSTSNPSQSEIVSGEVEVSREEIGDIQEQETADDDIKDELEEATDEDIKDELEEAIDEDIKDELEEITDEDVRDELEETTDEDIKDESEEITDEDIKDESEEITDEDIKDELEEITDEDVRDELEETTDEDIKDESEEITDEDIRDESEETVDEDVKGELEGILTF